MFKSSLTQFSCRSAVALALVASSSQVMAHGYLESPKARQAICHEQGGYWWPSDGSRIPNAACRAAFLESGHYPFVQHHESAQLVADYRNMDAVKAAVTDGNLCGAGDPNKAGISLPSPDWQRTEVTPDGNGQIDVRFRATTPHNPSFWEIYLTKPDYNGATDTLTWDDLEKIDTFGDLPIVVGDNGNRYYEMTVTLPADRQGDAILYSRWQRIDPAGEGFYNCADITITPSQTAPAQWHELGYFVPHPQMAALGDRVRARLHNRQGQEVVDVTLTLTDQNVANWPHALASLIEQQANVPLRIGVMRHGEIHFNADDVVQNQVFSHHDSYSFNLSVIPATDEPTSNLPAWSASDVYVAKDRVRYGDNIYQAKWWTRNEATRRCLVWQTRTH
uniref:Chitinase B n=1 Tax=Salinivibrio costicola TaxID=51367 RepID=Q7WWL1_SALCS|nr:chitinase B [Salinivibrio costicola]